MLAIDRRLKIAGTSLLGVFARCTERIVLVPPEVGPEGAQALEAGLEVTAVRMMVSGSSVLGSLISANSNGFVVTYHAGDDELRRLSEHGKVARLPARINAAGNVILANDHAAMVHPGLSAKACEAVADALCVEVLKGTVGGLKTVGMAALVTNKGLLVHPRASDAVFKLPVDVGTVNFGSPLVGSGLLANSKGYMAGDDSTGPELGRVEDALGFLD